MCLFQGAACFITLPILLLDEGGGQAEHKQFLTCSCDLFHRSLKQSLQIWLGICRQVQIMSFLVQRPKNFSGDYCPIEKRSVTGM